MPDDDGPAFYLACELCEAEEAVWTNDAEGMEALREHGDETHDGTIQYTVRREDDLNR